jgi:hypothetical protein
VPSRTATESGLSRQRATCSGAACGFAALADIFSVGDTNAARLCKRVVLIQRTGEVANWVPPRARRNNNVSSEFNLKRLQRFCWKRIESNTESLLRVSSRKGVVEALGKSRGVIARDHALNAIICIRKATFANSATWGNFEQSTGFCRGGIWVLIFHRMYRGPSSRS